MKIENKGYNNLILKFSTAITSGTGFYEGTENDLAQLFKLAEKANTVELIAKIDNRDMTIACSLAADSTSVNLLGLVSLFNNRYTFIGKITAGNSSNPVKETFTLAAIPAAT